LVRVTAAGVTPFDYTILSGGHHRAKAPLVLGNEGAGVIEDAIGEDLQRQYAELANRGQSATDAVAKDSYLRAAEALSGKIEKYLRMRA
jgi:NADPH:quinone reductase-like Zn-dependent oxidoreductase